MKSYIITVVLCVLAVVLVSKYIATPAATQASTIPDRFKLVYYQNQDGLTIRVFEDTLTKRTYLVTKHYSSGGVTLMP